MTVMVPFGFARLLPVLAATCGVAACAPAPLYTASGAGRPAVYGEIPRDGRGEPVWDLIRPAPGTPPVLTMEQVEQMARASAADEAAEGSRLGDPR